MDIYYKHFFTQHSPTGGVTFLVHHDRESGHMNVSWAVCSGQDMFCRRTGREIAENNMASGFCAKGQYDEQVPLVVKLCNILEEHNPSGKWERRYCEQALVMIEYVALKDSIFSGI